MDRKKVRRYRVQRHHLSRLFFQVFAMFEKSFAQHLTKQREGKKTVSATGDWNPSDVCQIR